MLLGRHPCARLAAAQAGDGPALAALVAAAGPAPLAQPTDQNDTLLHWAAFKGLDEPCKLLLERGVRLDARGECANTPLHLAAAAGHQSVVKLLLSHGAPAVGGFGESQCSPARAQLAGGLRAEPKRAARVCACRCRAPGMRSGTARSR